jgi:hypothetical protein
MCNVLFGTAFALWEQTRCLAARLHPPPGGADPPLAHLLKLTGFEFFSVMSAMILCAALIRSSAYGLRLMEVVLKPELMTPQARRPVPGWVLKVSVLIALLGGAQGLRSFMGFIEQGVWQQTWRWEQISLETYALAMWSVGLLGMIWRFYRAQHLGMSMPHEVAALPPACQSAVHAAIYRGDHSHAVRLCCDATDMDASTATRCVNGLVRHLREVHSDKFRHARRQVAISVYLGAMIGVCAIVPVVAFVLAPSAWQHATLAALLGIFLGITLMDMENWLREPLHRIALFVTCAVLLARAIIIKMEQQLLDDNYLWLASGILVGAGIVAAAARGGKPVGDRALEPAAIPAQDRALPDVARS